MKNTLFNNPMVTSAKKAMTQKDLDRYKRLGESMYTDIDFKSSTITNNIPQPMIDGAIYIESMLKSGLHPSILDDDEKNVMTEVYGDEWYKKYGYVKEYLTDIVTLTFK